jgi:gluconate 2-dehydrogenase gamma chain
MDTTHLSRRSLLQAVAAAVASAAAPIGWEEIAHAMDAANASQAGGGVNAFLSTAEAADVEAVAAQIVPTDDTPGAREAGVVHFIDRALATLFPQISGAYRTQLADFRAAYRTRHPAAISFAALTPDEQIAFLKGVEQTPFFATTRLLTLLGMFSLPEYGGNRDGVGWKLIGFEEAHVFRPPFGYYDRDYPGFAAAMKSQ